MAPTVWEMAWWWAAGVARGNAGNGASTSATDYVDGDGTRGRRYTFDLQALIRLIRGRHRTSPSSSSTTANHTIILTHKYVVGLLAFLISADLVIIVGLLCYELFVALYFPWHLYPLMLNRIAELLSFICSRGQILAAFSIAQMFLSVLSLTIFSKKQPCTTNVNCLGPLILYGISISYQACVALIVMKLSRMPIADDEGNIIANPPRSTDPTAPLGIQIIGLSPRNMRARVIRQVRDVMDEAIDSSSCVTLRKLMDMEQQESLANNIILTVEQPNGEKSAIARVCERSSSRPDTRYFEEQRDPHNTIVDFDQRMLNHSIEMGSSSNEEGSCSSSENNNDIENTISLCRNVFEDRIVLSKENVEENISSSISHECLTPETRCEIEDSSCNENTNNDHIFEDKHEE